MNASNAAVRMRSRTPAEPSFPFGLDIGTGWYHTAAGGTDWYPRLRKKRAQVVGNHLPNPSRSRVCRLATVLRRVHPSEAAGDGSDRSPSRHRDVPQLPVLWARLHPSRCSRPASATGFRRVCGVLGPRYRLTGNPGTSLGTRPSALLAVRRRIQRGGSGRLSPRLLPRGSYWPTRDGGAIGRGIRDPCHLRASADDLACSGVLFADAP